ncbi:BglG family transcription antiterminator [Lactiplantibacillus plajomi]|uniref:Ascorbate-specific PTS system EIIA component n=1 Tax=Lactiplantibacillus plajomi TaxID=1457217 RepID=A0ABV6K2K1_9LACO|nr:PTS sugar transporter subunit IIA [Lactiplantibacillus plajomi]
MEKACRILSAAAKTHLIEYHFSNPQVKVTPITSKEWAMLMTNLTRIPVYRREERRDIVYLLCYSEFERLSVYHFQSFLNVSKGTIISDIKQLRQYLSDFKVRVDYQRQSGFYLTGNELTIRSLAQQAISRLFNQKSGQFALYDWIRINQFTSFSAMRDEIMGLISKSNMTVVPERLDEITFFLCGTVPRLSKLKIMPVSQYDVRSLRLFAEIKEFFPVNLRKDTLDKQTQEKESAYITFSLLTVADGNIESPIFDEFLEYSANIIQKMEKLMGIEFNDYRDLLLSVFNHLVPAYFRIVMDFRVINNILDNVKKEYKDIYIFTRQSLNDLSKSLNIRLSDSEVALLTVLFAGSVYNNREEYRNACRAMIVCPNGTSSSVMLQSELKQILPAINFEKIGTIREVENVGSQHYDMIFTTVELEVSELDSNKVFIVHPLMSQAEKNKLIYDVQKRVLLPELSVPSSTEVIEAIKPYVSLNPGVTLEDLYKAVNRKFNKFCAIEEDDRPMLTDLITKDTIQVTDEKLNWKEAIAFAAKPLVKQGAVEPRYVDAMIDKVEQYGPFIHIGRGIAMPHARPEDGVNKIGMSVLKVKHPILLLDQAEHEVSLFICLAAIDNTTHLRALSSLADILSDEKVLDELLNENDTNKILSILQKGDK